MLNRAVSAPAVSCRYFACRVKRVRVACCFRVSGVLHMCCVLHGRVGRVLRVGRVARLVPCGFPCTGLLPGLVPVRVANCTDVSGLTDRQMAKKDMGYPCHVVVLPVVATAPVLIDNEMVVAGACIAACLRRPFWTSMYTEILRLNLTGEKIN